MTKPGKGLRQVSHTSITNALRIKEVPQAASARNMGATEDKVPLGVRRSTLVPPQTQQTTRAEGVVVQLGATSTPFVVLVTTSKIVPSGQEPKQATELSPTGQRKLRNKLL